MSALCLAALASASSCGRVVDIHETQEVTSSTCISCHTSAFRAASNPVHTNFMPETCQDCHTTKAWTPVHLDNRSHRWWPIQNKHLEVQCAACHTKGFRLGDTSKECQGCHRKDYDGAKEPSHTGSGFPLDCTLCHSDAGFRPSTYKHPWPLEGAHATATCAACHTGDPPRFKETPKECRDCHQKDADGAKNPIHQGLSTTCTDCHTTVGWKPSSYVHTWPLRGKHVLVACNSCHTGTPATYKGTTTDCYGCHKAAADASTFANHGTFPHTCVDCHVMSGWKPAITGLHPEASFPLTTGKHADTRIKCQDCHILAKGTSSGGQNTDCIHCHLASHNRPAIDTKHAQLGVAAYPTAPTSTNYCLQCHPAGAK